MSTSTHCKDTGTLEPASSLLSTLTIAGGRAKAHAKQLHAPLEHSAGQSQLRHLYSLLHSPGSGTHSTKTGIVWQGGEAVERQG